MEEGPCVQDRESPPGLESHTTKGNMPPPVFSYVLIPLILGAENPVNPLMAEYGFLEFPKSSVTFPLTWRISQPPVDHFAFTLSSYANIPWSGLLLPKREALGLIHWLKFPLAQAF
jgi:hypothetical protein